MPTKKGKNKNTPQPVAPKALEPCGLCGRPFGQKIEMHHLIPKSQGGKTTIALHPICHRTLHALFNEKELARNLSTLEALRAQEDVQRFINWISRKPLDFYRQTRKKARS
jgi:5-methylcytosine-specific restriction endonuclease McrA